MPLINSFNSDVLKKSKDKKKSHKNKSHLSNWLSTAGSLKSSLSKSVPLVPSVNSSFFNTESHHLTQLPYFHDNSSTCSLSSGSPSLYAQNLVSPRLDDTLHQPDKSKSDNLNNSPSTKSDDSPLAGDFNFFSPLVGTSSKQIENLSSPNSIIRTTSLKDSPCSIEPNFLSETYETNPLSSLSLTSDTYNSQPPQFNKKVLLNKSKTSKPSSSRQIEMSGKNRTLDNNSAPVRLPLPLPKPSSSNNQQEILRRLAQISVQVFVIFCNHLESVWF
jgi:hypothetical protein